MWFESGTVTLEILIGGYTDRPWYFQTEHMGRNALECQVALNNEETGEDFVMWDEILQTEEIVAIHDGLAKILSGVETQFRIHSEYETFAIAVQAVEDGFDTLVQIQKFGGNVREKFSLSRTLLSENCEYLKICCEKYPVRNV